MNHRSNRGRGPVAAPTSRLALGAIFVAASLAMAPRAEAAPMKILALGDSITYGLASPESIPGGYRAQLFRDLTEGGDDPQFQGTSIANYDPSLPPPSSPHDGHSGFLIDGQGGQAGYAVNTYIDQWLKPGNGVDPDYILVMLGANHILGQYQTAAAPYELAALVTRISDLRPDAKILVSTLTPQASAAHQAQVEQFNRTIGGPSGLIAQLQSLGERVTLADVGSSIGVGDLSDEVHPNAEGYRKLGNAWYRAILQNRGPLAAAATPAPEPSTLAVIGLGVAAGWRPPGPAPARPILEARRRSALPATGRTP